MKMGITIALNTLTLVFVQTLLGGSLLAAVVWVSNATASAADGRQWGLYVQLAVWLLIAWVLGFPIVRAFETELELMLCSPS